MTTSYSYQRSHCRPVYDFLLVGHCEYSSIFNFVIICEIKWDIGWKSRFFHTTPAFDAPVTGSPSERCHTVWYRISRTVWLPDGEGSLNVQPFQQNTDGQTSCDSIASAIHSISRQNMNLAIANRSRVGCAHNTLRAFIGLNITPWSWNLG